MKPDRLLTLLLSLFLASCAGVPPSIEKLAGQVQGKSPEEIRTIMIRQFGHPDSITGSGLGMDHWVVGTGVLSFHPLDGPVFQSGHGDPVYLLSTHNSAGKNLRGSYEMVSPSPTGHAGMKYWVGNLHIKPDLSYAWKSRPQLLYDGLSLPGTHFFLQHSAGRVDIQYARGVTEETLLETLPANSAVAAVCFHSADGRAAQTFTITNDKPGRRLVFGSRALMPFAMDKGWDNCWK